ncbi:hypothetical protein D3C78_1111870 [compost metagenome]
MNAIEMAEPNRTPGFIEGRHRIQPVAQPCHDGLGVTLEGVRRGARGPAAVAHQRQRQVPMIKRRIGLDAARLAAINEAVVKIQPLLVDRTETIGNDARPGDGETIGLDTHVLDEIEILFPAIVMIAGDITIVTPKDMARHVAEGIPDGGLAAIRPGGAFDLERGSRDAEQEVAGETGC